MSNKILFTLLIVSLQIFAADEITYSNGNYQSEDYIVGYNPRYRMYWGMDKNRGLGLIPKFAKDLFKQYKDAYNRQEREKIDQKEMRKLEFRKAE